MIVEKVKKADNILMYFEQYLLALLLFLMVVAIFGAVLDRFVFQSGQVWLEEFSRYVSAWAAFIGAGLGVKMGAHIGIEALVQVFPPKIRRLSQLLVNVIGILFSASVLFISFTLIERLAIMGQLSPALRIPVYWAYLSVPAGCSLMLIHYIFLLIICLYQPGQIASQEGVEYP